MKWWIAVAVSVLAAICGGQPVEVSVVDAVSGEPIQKFEYFAIVETADGARTGSWRDWHESSGSDGRLTLDLPNSCKLKLGVRSREYEWGYPGSSEYIITSDAASRSITHKLQPGATVHGTVVDEKAGEPVAGARLSPTIFTPPGQSPDHERSVFSDADGRFILPGVGDMGFTVEHPDYLDFRAGSRGLTAGQSVEREIRLEGGATLFGVVVDSEGRPLAGTVVDDGTGKSAHTDERGRFTIRGSRPWVGNRGFYLGARKLGFARYGERHDDIPAEGLTIVLDRLFKIRGVVVGPDGRPVPSFRVVAGPGRAPRDYQCETVGPNGADAGEFVIGIEYESAANWIGVEAPGLAPFETWVPMDRELEPLRITLGSGVSVSGRVVVDSSEVIGGVAQLLFDRPQWDNPHVADSVAKLLRSSQVDIGADGSFRFDHVTPGHYMLHLGGDNFTGRWMMANISGDGLAIGNIAVTGVGTITGLVLGRDGEPWAFADGKIEHAALSSGITDSYGQPGNIRFRTDEDGRFEVSGVPVGEAIVQVSYNLTADIVGGSVSRALVLAERATEVTVDCTSGESSGHSGVAVTANVQVGDGSGPDWMTGSARAAKRTVGVLGGVFGRDRGPSITGRMPRFRLVLDPLGAGNSIDVSEELDADGPLVARGVVPGRYLMSVFDAPLPIRFYRPDPLFSTEVLIADEGVAIDVPLGAGAITGCTPLPKSAPRDPTWAIARVYALDQHGQTLTSIGDENGSFGLRYLNAATYECVVRHEHLGWSRFDPVRVDRNVVDVGERELRSGATVHGMIRLESASPVATAIWARGPSGIEFEAVSYDRRRSNYVPAEFTIPSLWPGEWAIRVMREDEVLGAATAIVPESGSVEVEIVIKSPG